MKSTNNFFEWETQKTYLERTRVWVRKLARAELCPHKNKKQWDKVQQLTSAKRSQTAGWKTSQNLENCIEKAKKAGRKKFRIMYLRVRKEN